MLFKLKVDGENIWLRVVMIVTALPTDGSFSIIMWEMLTGQQAWVTLDYKQMVAAVLRDRKRPLVPPDTPKDCKDLLDQCWAQDPNDRPSFTAIVVHLQETILLLISRLIMYPRAPH